MDEYCRNDYYSIIFLPQNNLHTSIFQLWMKLLLKPEWIFVRADGEKKKHFCLHLKQDCNFQFEKSSVVVYRGRNHTLQGIS